MTDVQTPSTRRLLALALLVGVALLATLARILVGERSPWVLSMALAFVVMLLVVGQQLWARDRRNG